MKVVVCIEKGGTGKSTLSTNLVQMRASHGRDVLLVDTDKQESSFCWASLREEQNIKPVIHKARVTGNKIYKDLDDLASRYDDLIIDVGGRDTPELRNALLIADIAIVPVMPAQFDIWSLDKMEGIISECQTINTNLKAYSILSKAEANPRIKETEEAIELLNESDIVPFSGITIRNRVAFRKASSKGLGVQELKPKDTKASQEIETLYNFIFKD